MALFDILLPEKSENKLKELKEKLELNPNYIQEKEAYKITKEFKVYTL
ncbi:MAG: hypothetical protein ACFFB0_03465 [Promethearchaeota archaeon]